MTKKVNNECTLHNSIVLAVFVPKLSNLVQIWRSFNKTNFRHFWHTM